MTSVLPKFVIAIPSSPREKQSQEIATVVLDDLAMIMFNRVITAGISYLHSQQQRDGSFVSLSSPHRLNFQKAHSFHSPFATELILSSLSTLEETPVLKTIKQKAASFLLTQKSDIWSFNYWTRGSEEANSMPYPDDLDDTFCALSALFQYDPKLIDGKALAKIVMLLTATEAEEGGPYRTWLVRENAPNVWKDVDVAVNSNIAYFLSLQDIQLPKLHAFIESRIEHDLSSSYYPTVFPLIYFISRFYKGGKREKLIKILFRHSGKPKAHPESLNEKSDSGQARLAKAMAKRARMTGFERSFDPLRAALCICSLLNFNVSPAFVEKDISELIRSQKKGSWEASGFCVDPARKGKTYYAGSSALTTAFCLEAIGKYLRIRKIEGGTNLQKREDLKASAIRSEVIEHVRQRFFNFPKEVSTQAENMLATITKMDEKNQITLLPYFFRESLGKRGSSLSDEFLSLLGAANTYGWMAYTIYDNFWDEEGDPKTLAIANIALRELTTIYSQVLPQNKQFQKLSHTIMDNIDASNAWEVAYCRLLRRHSGDPAKPETPESDSGHLPARALLRQMQAGARMTGTIIPRFGNYARLAEKSLGHALGPVAILFLLGYKKDAPQIKHLLSFFTHYLIARQLNDDAHDWQKDLEKGHITPVVALLVDEFKTDFRDHFKPSLSFSRKRESRFSVKLRMTQADTKLREVFWYKTIIEVCSLVRKHVRLAGEHLKAVSIIKSPHVFEELLSALERAAQEALDEREKTIAFLDTYQKTT